MSSFQLPISRPISISFPSHERNEHLSLSRSCIGASRSRGSSSVLRVRLAGRIKACAAVGNEKERRRIELPGGLNPEQMPKHIAVIMDGNRRWATNKGYPVKVGHRAGAEALKRIALSCRKFGVEVVTVYAFSTENWRRPQEEVDYLMKLFEEIIRPRIKGRERSNNIKGRLTILGNRSQLPESLQTVITSAEILGENKKGPRLVIACNYSGCSDITESAKKIAAKVRDGVLRLEDIDESMFAKHLQTNGIEHPNPDLMIRTSGELRLSNFMLWELAHTHLFFSKTLFPDFGEPDLVQAIAAYQRELSE